MLDTDQLSSLVNHQRAQILKVVLIFIKIFNQFNKVRVYPTRFKLYKKLSGKMIGLIRVCFSVLRKKITAKITT